MKKLSTLFLALLVALGASKAFGFSWTVNGSSATNTGGRNYAITLPAGTTSANVVCDPTGVSGDHTYMRYTFNNSLALADVPGWWTVPQNQPQTYWTGDWSWEWRPPQTMTKTISGFGSGSWRVIVEGENYDWTQSYVLTVTVPGTNNAPTISWVQAPASANVNQWFTVQARGNDADGNLSNVSVWKDWVPFAFNGGGNGWESYSDANMAMNSSPGTTTFQAQSADSAGASSAVIYHTVTINSINQQPSVTMQLLDGAKNALPINGNGRAQIAQNQTFYIRVTGTDPDGNLSQLYSRINSPGPAAYAYEQVGASGAMAVHDFGPYTASQLGVWDAWAHATDTTAGAYQWQGGGWWGTHSPDLEVVAAGTPADNDGDGVPNDIEIQLGTNPNSAAQADSGNSSQLKINHPLQ
jgi:hypothetical protein